MGGLEDYLNIKKSSVSQAVGTQAFPVPVSWILFKNLLRYYD